MSEKLELSDSGASSVVITGLTSPPSSVFMEHCGYVRPKKYKYLCDTHGEVQSFSFDGERFCTRCIKELFISKGLVPVEVIDDGYVEDNLFIEYT